MRNISTKYLLIICSAVLFWGCPFLPGDRTALFNPICFFARNDTKDTLFVPEIRLPYYHDTNKVRLIHNEKYLCLAPGDSLQTGSTILHSNCNNFNINQLSDRMHQLPILEKDSIINLSLDDSSKYIKKRNEYYCYDYYRLIKNGEFKQ